MANNNPPRTPPQSPGNSRSSKTPPPADTRAIVVSGLSWKPGKGFFNLARKIGKLQGRSAEQTGAKIPGNRKTGSLSHHNQGKPRQVQVQLPSLFQDFSS
jgi:hypothetical protein